MLSTSLSSQLKTLKQQNLAKKLDLSQPPSSLLFSTSVSRTVDLDLLYTLAMIGYENLKHQISLSGLAIELLSQQMKGVNRNHLTLDQNKKLSTKLKKLILVLSPLLLSEECQKIVDYLMRNFSIHIFQGEYLALVHIMYFQLPIYPKLLANINIETPNLSFLKPVLRNNQKINNQFMIRAFQHNRYLLNTITRNLQELTLLTNKHKQQTVVIGRVQDQSFKSSHLSFVSNIYLGIFNRNNYKHSQEIIKFCFNLLKITSQDECIEIVLTLLTTVLLRVNIQEPYILSFINKLVDKSIKLSNYSLTNVYYFILFAWQKHPSVFNPQLIDSIIESPLSKHLLKPKTANCVIYLSLNKAFFEGIDCVQILKQLSLHVKDSSIIRNNQPLQEMFYDQFFSLYVNSDLKDVENINIYEQIIKSSFMFQFAEYSNRVEKTLDNKILYKIFNKKQIEPSGRINMKGIVPNRLKDNQQQIKQQNYTKMLVEEQKQSDSQQEQEQQNKEQNKQQQPSEVRQIIQSMEIQYNKGRLIELVTNYYTSETPTISSAQKNMIIEKLDENIYTDEYILRDIQNKDWIQPLSQIKTSNNLEVLSPIINLLANDMKLLEDIVYKDLLRQVLIRLGVVSKSSYNNVVNILSEFSDKLIKNITEETNPAHIYSIYEIVFYASEQIIKHNGVIKGKLFRLILSVIKLLTLILNSKLYENKLVGIFREAFKLFEERNLYIFFVGFASLISKMKFDSVTITKWKRILIEIYLQDNTEGVIVLIQAWSRSISFCTSLVEKVQEFKENPRNIIPKKVLVNLFGLIKPKQKAKLARNILFIVRYIALSAQFSKLYNQNLQKLPEHLRVQLVKQTTDLYSFALAIETQDTKLQSALQQLLHDIANLYPLDLIVKVITPLLPDSRLYSILLQKLEPHPRFRGKSLQNILRVVPDKVSSEWLKIVTLCLQRGCRVEGDFVARLLSEQTVESLALIAEVSKHQSSILIPHLKSIMSQLFTIQIDSEYRQAITYTLVNSLKGLLEPFLQKLVLSNIDSQTQYSESLLQSLVQNFQIGKVLDTIKKIRPSSSSQHINICVLLKQVANFNEGSRLISVFYQIFESITQLLSDQEVDLNNLSYIQSLQSETFQSMCLKLNESQLNKVLNNLAVWSEKNIERESMSLGFSLRKLISTKIFYRLSQTMKDLFVNFHKYLYDSLVIDLNKIQSVLETKNKNQLKRGLSIPERGISLIDEFISTTLSYFKSLFDNDPEQYFIDTVRFQKLSKTLSNIFTLNPSSTTEKYLSFITTQLTPTVVSLCLMVKDDYKLKTLNANILEKLSLSNMLTNRGIFTYLGEEMSLVGERNLVLFNDLLPYLAEYRESRDKNVQSGCRAVIAQIQQMSGEKIDSYFQR